MKNEREFLIIKPNSIRRGFIGEIIKRLENRGIKIIAMKMINISEKQVEKLYKIHKEKEFYKSLKEFMLSGPVVVMVVEAPRAIEMVRHIIGNTDPLKASPGSIRGDYGLTVQKNIVHASDSIENANSEISIFFEENEILKYELDGQNDL
ncbi:nucleoside-diphosphate kinase [Geotoga petraea]|jgi:nucleoside-diphosphate kinase|uniref:Nucleoside diphosphate kinase n=1 Tax=Geotoga petraea TaxID=28234 RepID=A0A1G6JKF6_9BACT|nr:nucleoside-diphosphate kinase [Geotoga petraea]MDK2945390.1 nucleoside-diphosphate kinase [Geotoga sp.]TGG88247.1 nucleoside-diphosphate kinase [Geotoga petraea]SDC19204.1 nucleoside diphosphate kinase [Geotoga petraea]